MKIKVLPNLNDGCRFRYHHFIFGYVFPVIQNEEVFKNTYYFENCGEMNKILLELGFKIIIDGKNNEINNNVFYKGYDKFFEGIDIRKIKKNILKILDIKECKKKEEILIVDRGNNPRRSVPNIEEIFLELSKYTSVKKIYLDNLKFKDQIIEFKKHKKIILQHGAAMSNLIWCDEKTKIFEISPNPNYYWIYDKLIKLCNLNNKKIIQKNEHAPLEAKKITKFVLNNKFFL